MAAGCFLFDTLPKANICPLISLKRFCPSYYSHSSTLVLDKNVLMLAKCIVLLINTLHSKKCAEFVCRLLHGAGVGSLSEMPDFKIKCRTQDYPH